MLSYFYLYEFEIMFLWEINLQFHGGGYLIALCDPYRDIAIQYSNVAGRAEVFLRDHNIPLPKVIIAISPWTNAANDFPSVKANEKKDIILGEKGLIMRNQIYDPIYFQGANIKNPYVSPVNGDYKEIGNLLIQVGGHEILLDDALKVAQKARETGCNAKITVYYEMPHDFQVLIPQLEQSQKAWNEIKNFIEENI